MLGFEDDLNNFTLMLSNPSTQAEMLKIENTAQKIQLYNDATRSDSGGIAAMSHSKAKKEILNMSEEEILTDYNNQRVERVINQELQNAPQMFGKTGIFDKVDTQMEKIDVGEQPQGDQEGGEEGGLPDLGGPPSGGGGGQEGLPAMPPAAGGGGDIGLPKEENDEENDKYVLREGKFNNVLSNYLNENKSPQTLTFEKKSHLLQENAEKALNEIDEKLKKANRGEISD
jgi:hypothetical protein